MKISRVATVGLGGLRTWDMGLGDFEVGRTHFRDCRASHKYHKKRSPDRSNFERGQDHTEALRKSSYHFD